MHVMMYRRDGRTYRPVDHSRRVHPRMGGRFSDETSVDPHDTSATNGQALRYRKWKGLRVQTTSVDSSLPGCESLISIRPSNSLHRSTSFPLWYIRFGLSHSLLPPCNPSVPAAQTLHIATCSLSTMFVIKATLKDETRRLVFDGRSFPSYGEVQQKVSDDIVSKACESSLSPFPLPSFIMNRADDKFPPSTPHPYRLSHTYTRRQHILSDSHHLQPPFLHPHLLGQLPRVSG